MTLRIKNLSKKYDETSIFQEISFEVEKGEIFGVFGVVGVGKSTLLRTISGALETDAGEIFLGSDDLTSKPCEERGFHFPSITNSSFWQNIFNTDKPSELADGEGQALALEDALEKADKVLLLDNQFCLMDRQQREIKAGKLKNTVKTKNLAVIFATSNYEEIFSICDRVAILDKGKLIQIGTPREVYENPKTVAAANATGRNNIIEAKLISDRSEVPEFITTKGEHRISTQRTPKMNSQTINKIVNLAIRPEHISISFGASFPEDNLLKAEITEIVYQGATTLIKLIANGLSLEALVLRLVGLNVGDECVVGLPPDRILVMND